MPEWSQIVTVLCYLCAALTAQIRLVNRRTNTKEYSRRAVSSPFLCRLRHGRGPSFKISPELPYTRIKNRGAVAQQSVFIFRTLVR
jgi:hypothetical protein